MIGCTGVFRKWAWHLKIIAIVYEEGYVKPRAFYGGGNKYKGDIIILLWNKNNNTLMESADPEDGNLSKTNLYHAVPFSFTCT